MTDNLQNKFQALSTQLLAQHTELMAALNALLGALGAPPPSPGATLGDVRSDLAGLLLAVNGIRTDMAAQQFLLRGSVDLLVQDAETMINNGSLNTQRILAALAQLDPCKVCDTPTYQIPPVLVDPAPANSVHCQRMQALLYAIQRLCVKFDILSSFGVNFSTTVVTDAIQEVITELSPSGTLVVPSVLEAAHLAAVAIGYVASSLFVSNSLPGALNIVHEDLLSALYAADNAAEGMNEYAMVINASNLNQPTKNMLIALGYNELFNYYYYSASPESVATFNGSLCAPATIFPPAAGCTQLSATAVLVDGNATWAIVWPSGGTDTIPAEARPGYSAAHASHPVWLTGVDLTGYTVRYVEAAGGIAVYEQPAGPAALGLTPTPQTILASNYLAIVSGGPFTVEICHS